MEEFFKNFAQSKIPSLFIVGLFLSIGFFLIKGEDAFSFSPSILWGSIFFIFGILLGVLSYADQRNKEHIDNIISNYKKTLEDIQKARSFSEEITKSSLTDGKENSQFNEQYTNEMNEGTSQTSNFNYTL